jgi:hypothetical protein
MAKINLRNSDKPVHVDEQDTHLVDKRWELHSNGYVICRETVKVGTTSCRRCLYLHRAIMAPGRNQRIRFRDGDPLNCRRKNLRVVGPAG